MRDESWVVIDTETTGLYPPIYAIEIAAQRMRGWKKDGSPFRVLLNHDVPIDPAAEAVHGYTRAFLREHGADPLTGHQQFLDYVEDLPLVAYNIGFDWDRVLVPEYERLAIRHAGKKGFCAMTLARRTISECADYRLTTLREHFGLNPDGSHRGDKDVSTVCVLFDRIFEPRLTAAGVVGFQTVAAFSRQTPVARCLQQISRKPDDRPTTNQSNTATNRRVPAPVPAANTNADGQRWRDEMIGLARGIAADGLVNEQELRKLMEWLTTCPFTHVHPISAVAETVEKIVCDGFISTDELQEMRRCLHGILPDSR